MKRASKAPTHLSPDSKRWFENVLVEFDLDEHHIRLLTKACEAWDRSETARLALKKYGLTFEDRFGSPKARPEVAISRDSMIAFARLTREIGLDVADPSDSRPPALPANRRA